MSARVEVFRREDRKFDWRLKADNGEIVATSGGQGYERVDGALHGLSVAAKALGREVTVELLPEDDGAS